MAPACRLGLIFFPKLDAPFKLPSTQDYLRFIRASARRAGEVVEVALKQGLHPARRSTRTAFVPPKANELDSITCAAKSSRAVLET